MEDTNITQQNNTQRIDQQSTPTPDSLPPTLNDTQLRSAIDQLIQQQAPQDFIQGFINNYKNNGDGTFSLKPAPFSLIPQPGETQATQKPSLSPGSQYGSPFGISPDQNNGPLEGIADLIGGSKLAQGLGQTIANWGGAQKNNIAAQNQGMDIQTHLIQQIRDDKLQGKDTSRLEQALQVLGGSLQQEGQNTENLGTSGLSTRDIIGSAVQLGANVIPGIAEETGLAKTATSTLGKLGGNAAVGAATGYGIDVGNKMQNQDNTNTQIATPGLGTAIGAVAPFAGALIGGLAKKIVGFTTGTGEEVIQRALDNPDVIQKAVSTYAKSPEQKTGLLEKAKSTISDFVQQKQNEFGNTINNLPANENISKQPAIDAFTKGLDKFGVEVNGNKLDFSNSSLTSADKNGIKEAYAKLNNWTDETPKGLDRLRQTLGSFMDDFKIQGNTRANVILGGAQQALKSHLSDNLTGYAKTLSDYASKSKITNDILKELQLGGKTKETTQLANIMKIFKKDPIVQQKLSTIMGPQGSEDFLNQMSGAILSDWLPSNKLGNYLRLGAEGAELASGAIGGNVSGSILPVAIGAASMSPRIVGEVTTRLAKPTGKLIGEGVKRGAQMIGSKITQ